MSGIIRHQKQQRGVDHVPMPGNLQGLCRRHAAGQPRALLVDRIGDAIRHQIDVVDPLRHLVGDVDLHHLVLGGAASAAEGADSHGAIALPLELRLGDLLARVEILPARRDSQEGVASGSLEGRQVGLLFDGHDLDAHRPVGRGESTGLAAAFGRRNAGAGVTGGAALTDSRRGDLAPLAGQQAAGREGEEYGEPDARASRRTQPSA